MATLVAPPLPGQPLDDFSSSAHQPQHHRRDRQFGTLLAATLAAFAVGVHGYHPYAEDGGLYAAGAKRILDPALFPHSAEFVREPMRLSVFAPFVAGLVRITGLPAATALPWVLLLLHLATLWMTLFAAWLLAGRIFAARRVPSPRPAQAGAVLLLACWIALPVAGSALLFMDPYLTARSFSTPCMILALIGTWDATEPKDRAARTTRLGGVFLLAISLLAAAAMHPLMASYGLAACVALVVTRAPSRSRRYAGSATLTALSVALAFTTQRVAQPESPAYAAVALTRGYWFLAQWRWYEWAGIVAPIAIVLAFASRSTRRDSRGVQAIATAAALTGALGTLVSILFVRPAASIHLVARLQPMRAMQFPYLVMILLLGGWLGARLGDRPLGASLWRWVAATTILSAPLYAASRATYSSSPHLELPTSAVHNPWAEAFLWARNHTPKDALFALDADYIQHPGEDAQCFRAIAERSALPDRSKDGGEAAIAPELTAAWMAGQQAQRTLDSATDEQRRTALQPLGVSWVVLAASSTTALPCPYANTAVKVCRLR